MRIISKHVAIKNSRAYNFFLFVKPGSEMGKVFPSDGSCVNLYVLFRADFLFGFFICLPDRRRMLMSFRLFI